MTEHEHGPDLEQIHIDLSMEPEDDDDVVPYLLGVTPYVLIEPFINADEPRHLVIKVSTGGGVPQEKDTLVSMLEDVVIALREGRPRAESNGHRG